MKYKDLAALRFRHFGMRLIERYGLYITFETYLELCKLLLTEEATKENSPKPAVTGYIEVKGIRVRVIKDNYKHKLLMTALPNYKKI